MDLVDQINELLDLINSGELVVVAPHKYKCICGVELCPASVKKHLGTEKHSTKLKAIKYEELLNKLNLSSTNS